MSWNTFLVSIFLAAIPTVAAAVIPQGRFSRRATLDGIRTDLEIAEKIDGTTEADWLRRYAQVRVRQYGLDATRRQHRRIVTSNKIAHSYLTEPEKRGWPAIIGGIGISCVYCAVGYFTGPRFLESTLSYSSLMWWIGMAAILLIGLTMVYHGLSRAFWPWKHLRADAIAQLHAELTLIDQSVRPHDPVSPARVDKIDMYEQAARRYRQRPLRRSS